MSAFTQLATPVDVKPSVFASWETVDVSANVTDASGVLLKITTTVSTSSDTVGLRKKGSTDTDTWSHPNTGTAYFCVGIDANDEFEIFIQSDVGDFTVELYGYFDATDVVFFTEPPRFTGGTNAYGDVDISTDTGGDTAIGAILQISNERNSNTNFALRPKGSSTDHFDQLNNRVGLGGIIIGVDLNEVFEAKRSSSFAGSWVKVMGYVKSGMTLFNDPTDSSLLTTGSYQDISLPAGADAGLFRVRSASNATYGIRPDGASFDPNDNIGTSCEQSATIVAGTSGVVEGQIAATTTDFFLWGTVDAAGGGVTITPDSGTVTYTGQVPTVSLSDHKLISVPSGTVSYTGQVPVITAGDNKSIEVPAGSFAYTGLAPTVSTDDNITVDVPVGSQSFTGMSPAVTASDHKTVSPGVGSEVYTGLAPTVGTPIQVSPGTGAENYTGQAPTVSVSANTVVEVPAGSESFSGLVPSVSVTSSANINVPVGAETYLGLTPAVSVTIDAIVAASYRADLGNGASFRAKLN